MNGFIYLALGALLLVWPGAVQTIFMDAPFVGHESALFRVLGMTVAIIGWLDYLAAVRALDNSDRPPCLIGWCSFL